MIRIAINGFGRIGRRVFRLLMDNASIEVVAINDVADSSTLSHLLKYDSIHGIFGTKIGHDDHHIIVNDRNIPLLNYSDPKAIPWTQLTPIKAAMDSHFHQDVHPDDVVAWPTNLGWVMGPWLIYSGLINRATIALYYGAPIERVLTTLTDGELTDLE